MIASALVALLAGCTPGADLAKEFGPPGQVKGVGSVEYGPTSVTASALDAQIMLRAPQLELDPAEALLQLLADDVIAGAPVEITATGGGPYTIERHYPDPLPEDVSATWAYFDEELGGWLPAQSSLSPDRQTLTATVDHLSLWSDIVAGAKSSIDTVKKAASQAGGAVVAFGGNVVEAGEKLADWSEEKLTDAATWLSHGVGAVFSVRVDPPTCSGDTPDWVEDVVMMEEHSSNPVLWCAGSNERDADILIVKARVNRGYGYGYATGVEPEWEENTTNEHGFLDTVLGVSGDLGGTIASSMEELTFNGHFVGAGEQVTFAFTEASVREDLEVGDPLVQLELPNAVGFLFGVMARVVVPMAESTLEGPIAAVMIIAACADAIRTADGVAGGIKAAVTCIRGQAEQVAQALASALGPRAADPARLGRSIGKWVGKASIYLVLVGPTKTTIDYGLAHTIPDSARRISVYTTTVVSPRTAVITINPFTAEGQLDPAWTLIDETYASNVDCGPYPSEAGTSSNTFACSPTAASAFACWAPPTHPGDVACVTDPTTHDLRLLSASGLGPTEPAQDPLPFFLELADGSHWQRRHGGSGVSYPDPYYLYYDPVPTLNDNGVKEPSRRVVVAQYGQEVIDTNAAQWSVFVAEPSDQMAPDGSVSWLVPPAAVNVTRAWFIESTMPAP
ncbi:hypothetical protein GCG21_15600 [Pseudactinotalea sp. HY160]|uniref:hypothetical protein n=1 Tax=Pseudactinotalea sp. HY160 TaxID=2654490 RepID=UPI00128E45B2|nr:hypothetical protein [Pseudactinotalea sp. HY160]MPV51409.1 hypothetical protein [Pseudactinotalea sp. HY160]